MRTLPKPVGATREVLDQCLMVIQNYKRMGCPDLTESKVFVDHLLAAGITIAEAEELLTIIQDDYKEAV